MRKSLALAALAALLVLATPAGAVEIVAAENFYGDVAQQIGGADVKVTSILSNPDQDPHLFEATPSVARAIADAKIVVSSGIDYDPWMEKLLAAAPAPGRRSIVVASLVHRQTGDNPHIWYDTHTMLLFAGALTDALVAEDPGHANGFRQRRDTFEQSLKPIEAHIGRLHARLDKGAVTATEPVLGYLLDALGLQSRNPGFQLAVMNGTEPSPSQVAAFETDLKKHRVRMLIYNSQASDPVAERMRNIAKASGVPVVGASETEPPGLSYQDWIGSTLDAIDAALPAPTQ
jgi:zinc/manganese transport system substrate-binding protein